MCRFAIPILIFFIRMSKKTYKNKKHVLHLSSHKLYFNSLQRSEQFTLIIMHYHRELSCGLGQLDLGLHCNWFCSAADLSSRGSITVAVDFILRLDMSCGWFHPVADSSFSGWIRVVADSILQLTRVPEGEYKFWLTADYTLIVVERNLITLDFSLVIWIFHIKHH